MTIRLTPLGLAGSKPMTCTPPTKFRFVVQAFGAPRGKTEGKRFNKLTNAERFASHVMTWKDGSYSSHMARAARVRIYAVPA